MQLGVRLATIVDVDLDPSRQQVVLDLGANDGVAVGQAFIDASGLLGQVTAVAPDHATALLVTDPDHAVPVQVVRSGLRVIRSEEHTSELQSLMRISNAVFCLKKKKRKTQTKEE